MKAIRVRHLPPTDKLPRRYKADDHDGHTFTLHVFESDQYTDAVYRKAAAALCYQMSWRGRLVEGGYGNDRFFVFDPLYPNHNPEMDYVSL